MFCGFSNALDSLTAFNTSGAASLKFLPLKKAGEAASKAS
jgi:hypothetical protein